MTEKKRIEAADLLSRIITGELEIEEVQRAGTSG